MPLGHIPFNHANIIEENARLNDELDKLSSSISTVNDPCATNSTSCEASILEENVELRSQLELLTSNYRKLEESHEKLSSSNDDLLAVAPRPRNYTVRLCSWHNHQCIKQRSRLVEQTGTLHDSTTQNI